MRCFLSYSLNADISVVKRILAENNIDYVSLIDSLEYGDNLATAIRRIIQDADFVLAVLDDSANVSFELGMAMGVKKPLFILAPAKNEGLSAYISEQIYAIAEPTDYEKISYSFRIFVENFLNQNQSSNRKVQKKPNKVNKGITISTDFVDSFKKREITTPEQFEDLIRELFFVLKIDVLVENRHKAADFQADFSLWINELDSVVGNPIIVEAKFTRDRSALKNAERQFSQSLKKFNAKIGLLIYNDPLNEFSSVFFSYSPLVLSISFQELINSLATDSLPEIIVRLRNRVIHKEIY